MSKKLLSQREIAVIKHVWTLTELESQWLDKYKIMRSKVADVIINSQAEKHLRLDDQLFEIVWTKKPEKCKMDDTVLMSFRAHYNSKTQVVLCHIVKTELLSCKSIELPEYEP